MINPRLYPNRVVRRKLVAEQPKHRLRPETVAFMAGAVVAIGAVGAAGLIAQGIGMSTPTPTGSLRLKDGWRPTFHAASGRLLGHLRHFTAARLMAPTPHPATDGDGKERQGKEHVE